MTRTASPTGDILRLAWPVLISQLAVMANGVIDTVMAGQLSAVELAAVGLGASIYVSVYIGLNGTLLALSPIIAQHFGAQRYAAIGAEVRQGLWLAAALSAVGCAVLVFHGPWLTLGAPPAEVAERTSLYLYAVAIGLPAALAFRVFQALNTAISRPKAVMFVNLAGLALKVPLNALFMFGWTPQANAWPGWLNVPALGGPGCAVATAAIAWFSALAGFGLLALDPSYRRLGWGARTPHRWVPDWPKLRVILKLGVPTGAAYMIEVTAFTFISIFVASFGATVAASQQIAANLVGVAYMFPLALANATSVLTAQAIGAADSAHAQRIALRGIWLALGIGLVLAAALVLGRTGLASAYASDPRVQAAAATLIVLVAAYHPFDAVQVMLAFVLRAYRIATLPMVVYAVALWGVGLGGGWWLTFAAPAWAARMNLSGAQPFWVAAVASVMVASVGLAWVLRRVLRRRDATA